MPPDDEGRRDPRREAILKASLQVFLRFGFRRTSMDEVARAAQLSRQGLYFHFATKETLFAETADYFLEQAFGRAIAALEGGGSLVDRTTEAFDLLYGEHVSGATPLGPHLIELNATAQQMDPELFRRHEARFLDAIAKHLASQASVVEAKALGLGAKDLARVLAAAASGLKHSAGSREDFVKELRVAVRAILRAPKR